MSEGAKTHELLLAAARDDNEEMLSEALERSDLDINYQDGVGNTALHYAAKYGSLDCLELLLEQEGCDVDYVNRTEGDTPLHLALQIDNQQLRAVVVESLLDAGADFSIKNKYGKTVLDLLPADDTVVRPLIRHAQQEASLAREEVVDDEDEEGEGSGSGSEE